MRRRLTTALGITAAVLGAGTAAATVAGTAPLLAQPAHEVQYIVEEGLPHGITQQSVEAANQSDPARSWTPITFRVTDDGLTSEQRLYGEDLDEDVVLSIGTGGMEGPDGDWLSHGVAYRDGVRPAGANRSTFDEERAFDGNRDLGHGATAVVATAHTIGEKTYDGPTRSPLLWLSLILGGASATLLALVWWARRRRRESAVERAFRAGRFDLARVILDHEALEVSFHSVPEGRRPHGFTDTWERLHDQAMRLARREEELARRVAAPGAGAIKVLAEEVADFLGDARDLAEQAHALEQSSQVHGSQSGGASVLDQIAQPLVTGVRGIQLRLAAAPDRTVVEDVQQELGAARDHLLDLIQSWTPDASAVRGAQPPGALLRQWEHAEERLGQAMDAVSRQLERFPGARADGNRAPAAKPNHLGTLRSQLGLPHDPAGRFLVHLARAEQAARSLLGPHPELDSTTTGDAAPGSEGREMAALLAHFETAARADRESRRRREDPTALLRRDPEAGGALRLAPMGWGAAVLGFGVVGTIAALLVSDAVQGRPVVDRLGDWTQDSVVINGPELERLDAERLQEFVGESFPDQREVVVAVRPAEGYLEPVRAAGTYQYEVDPEQAVEVLWQLKSELPDLVDPATGDLRDGAMIVPVIQWDQEKVGVMYPAAGDMVTGSRSMLATHANRDRVGYDDVTQVEQEVIRELDSFSSALQTNGINRPGPGEGWLVLALVTAFTALPLALLALAELLSGLSVGAGRFGRGSAALRKVKGQLEQLMLGLDESRLSAVAVLGAGPAGSPAEAEQRLYERSLVAAWREVEEIESLSVAERTRRATQERIEQLQSAVGAIAARESDVQARADAALRSQREA